MLHGTCCTCGTAARDACQMRGLAGRSNTVFSVTLELHAGSQCSTTRTDREAPPIVRYMWFRRHDRSLHVTPSSCECTYNCKIYPAGYCSGGPLHAALSDGPVDANNCIQMRLHLSQAYALRASFCVQWLTGGTSTLGSYATPTCRASFRSTLHSARMLNLPRCQSSCH